MTSKSWLITTACAVASFLAVYVYLNAPTVSFSSNASSVQTSRIHQEARASSTEASSLNVSVLDGDTIRLNDGKPNVRLIGFNTPETSSPRCAAEKAKGDAATNRLRELVSRSKVSVNLVACSCRPGSEGTDKCNFGRRCGVLLADGRDVGSILISEGLAVPFVCGATSCPPTPRPWC